MSNADPPSLSGESDVFIVEEIANSSLPVIVAEATSSSTEAAVTSSARATAPAADVTTGTIRISGRHLGLPHAPPLLTSTLRPRPLIQTNLRFVAAFSLSFTSKLNQVCGAWSPQLMEQRGVRNLLELLVNTIFEDNDRLFNIFLLDASICPTSSIDRPWGTTLVNRGLSGIRFRSFIQVNKRPYVIHIFDLTPSARDLALTFTLDYMHAKFRAEQLIPEIFPKAVGTLNIGSEMVVLNSSSGEDYFYPKKFQFFVNVPMSSESLANMSEWINRVRNNNSQ